MFSLQNYTQQQNLCMCFIAVLSVCPCTSLYYVLVKVPLKLFQRNFIQTSSVPWHSYFRSSIPSLLGITVNKLLLTLFCLLSCKNGQIIKILLSHCDIALLCKTVYLACNILTSCRAFGGLLSLSNKEHSLVSSLRCWLVSPLPPWTVLFS